MPGPYTTFNRATSDVPGAGQGEHWYSPHPSGLCRAMVWRPSASFQDAPAIVFVHGGEFTQYGDLLMSPEFMAAPSTWTAQVAETLNAAGWVVISIDVPPGPWIPIPQYEVSSFSTFPEPEALVAQAIAYFRGNSTAVADTVNGTDRAEDLWGAGNSINPSRIAMLGVGSGATLALMSSLTPDGLLLSHARGRQGQTVDPYLARYGGRPKAVVAVGGTIDWTQFDVDPATIGASALYQQDRHPHFNRSASPVGWSDMNFAVKWGASPLAQLQAKTPENKTLPVYASWYHNTAPNGANLGPEYFQTGRLLNDAGAGLAFRNPAHHFQGDAWSVAAAAHLSELSKTTWGDAGDNAQTPALTDSALAADVVDWLTNEVEV